MDFVNQDYWDNSYKKLNLDYSHLNDEITEFLETYFFSKVKEGNVFEVGCFPGRYLNIFGRKGFELNGIDTTSRVKDDLPEYFKSKNYTIGSFEQGDFLNLNESQKFDAVVSFGFIEHFDNWDVMIQKHINITKKGGYVVITVPNFSGKIQWLLHRLLDNENLKRHNIKSMNSRLWVRKLNELNIQYDCVFAGPFGGFDFWVDIEKRGRFRSWLLKKALKYTRKLKSKKISNSNLYSPYFGLVIRVN
jgi:SAM-dependent methyltransferase